jgi:hypothetical protein
MKKFLTASGAAVAMLLSVSAASALDERKDFYMTQNDSGERVVWWNGATEGSPLLTGENGAAPADCPPGSFYEGAQNQIFACEGNVAYSLSEPEEGTMMSSGEAYPEGAMVMNDASDAAGGTQPNGQEIPRVDN